MEFITRLGLRKVLMIGCVSLIAACSGDTDQLRLAEDCARLDLVFVTLSSDNSIIEPNQSQQYSIQGFSNARGELIDLADFTRWSTSEALIANVNGQGLATGSGLGSAIITASVCNLSDSKTLTVSDADLQSVSVASATGPTTEFFGCTDGYAFTALGSYDGEATPRDITDQVDWSTSNTAIAEIDATGSLSAKATGAAVVTASRARLSDGAIVSGNDSILINNEIADLVIQQSSLTLNIGDEESGQLSARANYLTIDERFVTDIATWSSSNEAVATVSNTGRVSGIAPGQVTITATCDGESDTLDVTIQTPPTITDIQIDTDTDATDIDNEVVKTTSDDDFKLFALGIFSDGSSSDLSNSNDVDWEIISGSSVSVDSDGDVEILTTGETTIRVTYDDGDVDFEDTIEIDVN